MANPTGIDADRAAGEITIWWDDEHVSIFSAAELRRACPCAECQGEWGRPGRLATLTELTSDETKLTDVFPVGSYAISPVWANGHQTGIFSFDYLREICPCADCRRTRTT